MTSSDQDAKNRAGSRAALAMAQRFVVNDSVPSVGERCISCSAPQIWPERIRRALSALPVIYELATPNNRGWQSSFCATPELIVAARDFAAYPTFVMREPIRLRRRGRPGRLLRDSRDLADPKGPCADQHLPQGIAHRIARSD